MAVLLGAIKSKRKKTVVKYWVGVSSDDRKAKFKEFDTKKEAKDFIKRERAYNTRYGREIFGSSHFYEIL